jgi:methionine-rich copper-binding protein CopC
MTMFVNRLIRAVTAGFMFLFLMAAPALGHAKLSRSDPRDGQTVEEPPPELVMTFTEPPSANGRVEVLDGCGRDIARAIDVLNDDMTVALAAGQPGTWRVRMQVVSGADGHASSEKFKFTVDGETDCSVAADDEGPTDNGESQGGGGIPGILIVAVGAGIVLAGLAFAVRRGGESN